MCKYFVIYKALLKNKGSKLSSEDFNQLGRGEKEKVRDRTSEPDHSL